MGTNQSAVNKIINQNEQSLRPDQPTDQAEVWRANNTQKKGFIGKGPLGGVIEAMNIKLQQLCAIKIIEYEHRNDKEFIYSHQKAKKMVQLSKTQHPNIAKTHICETIEMENSFSLKHKFAFIMDYYEQNLGTVIIQRQQKFQFFTEVELLVGLVQLLSALLEAQTLGYHHHNIKETNVFYNYKEHIFILSDFDLNMNNQNSQSKGDYSPPEFSNPDTNFDTYDYQKADIYALGVLFMKLALLIKTFENPSKDSYPVTLTKLVTKGYPRLYIILTKMIDKSPTKRFSINEAMKAVQEQVCEVSGFKYYEDELAFKYLTDNQQVVRNFINTGDMSKTVEDYRKALKSYEEALQQIFKSSSIKKYDRYQQATVLNSLSTCYMEIRDYQRALRSTLKSYKIKKLYLNDLDSWHSLAKVAKIYNKLCDYQNGLAWYLKAYTELTTTKDGNDDQKVVTCLENIAQTYENLEDWQNAHDTYGRICTLIFQYNEASQRFIKNLKCLVRVVKKMGNQLAVKEYEKRLKDIQTIRQ